MKNIKLSNYERETIINFNEGEDRASVYTHNKAMRNRLEQLVKSRPDDCYLSQVSHDNQAMEFCIPKNWIRINPPRATAPLTEEQRQKRREQLARLRQA